MKSQVSDTFIQKKQEKLFANLHNYEIQPANPESHQKKRYDMKKLKRACKDLSIDFDSFLVYCRIQFIKESEKRSDKC